MHRHGWMILSWSIYHDSGEMKPSYKFLYAFKSDFCWLFTTFRASVLFVRLIVFTCSLLPDFFNLYTKKYQHLRTDFPYLVKPKGFSILRNHIIHTIDCLNLLFDAFLCTKINLCLLFSLLRCNWNNSCHTNISFIYFYDQDLRLGQKCLTPRNKKKLTKIAVQIFVNFGLFPKELLLLPPFIRF